MPFFIQLPGLSDPGHLALAIFLAAAFLWLTEAIPIYATSLAILALQSFLLSTQGVLFSANAETWVEQGYSAPSYTVFLNNLAHPIIILFLAGFILAAAAVRYRLDRTLTKILVKPFGRKPSMVLLGVMVATATLSAFMSNTATTAMMMTVILPLLAAFPSDDRFKIALILGVPFAANVGGMATPIGTPPNAIAIRALEAQGIPIPFSTWMMIGVPVVVLLIALVWFLLNINYSTKLKELEFKLEGKLDRTPKALVLYIVFALTVLLWITEAIHGLGSSLIALMPIALLTAFKVVDVADIRKLPWEVLWLVAGGFSLGISLQNTGLAEWIIGLVPWGGLGFGLLLFLIGAISVVLANFLSNTVTAALLIPIIVSLSQAGIIEEGTGTVLAVLVVGICVSLGMCLPISTPPNAIAMSTGLLKSTQMTRVGIQIGILGLGVVLLVAFFYWSRLFSF